MATPKRVFEGEAGQRSVGIAGPAQLMEDLDKAFAMFDPADEVEPGVPGGIGPDNLQDDVDAIVGERTADPDLAPADNGPGTLTEWFSWIVNRFRAVLGGGLNWWEAPPTTLTLANTHHGLVNNPHVVTSTQLGVPISVDGVDNPGGDINLIAGANINIVPDNVGKTITFSTPGGTIDAHRANHEVGGADELDLSDLAGESIGMLAHRTNFVPHTYYATTGGIADTYTLTLSPVPAAYANGMAIAFRVHATNTGASTINVNGLGAQSIRKPNGNNVSAGNLLQDSIYTVRYNGTNFILQGSDAAGDATAGDVLTGKTFSNDSDVSINGTMPDRGATNFTPGIAAQSILAGYHNGSGEVDGDADLVEANIKDGKTIFGVAGSLAVGAVIKSVQSGSFSLTGSSSDRTITSVDRTKSLLLFNYNTTADVLANATYFVRGQLSADTTARFERKASTGTCEVEFFVIEFTSGVTVQYGTSNIANLSTEKDITIDAVTLAKSFVVATGMQSSVDGDYESVWRPSEGDFKASLTTTTNLKATRISTQLSVESSALDFAYFVVTFD